MDLNYPEGNKIPNRERVDGRMSAIWISLLRKNVLC